MAETAIVTIGTFDGFHLGHQAIPTEVRRQAERRGIAGVAYAFALPPRLQIDGEPRRCLLLPESIKIRLLESAVDRVDRAAFSEVRTHSPARFAEEILTGRLRAVSVVVGPSFRFGAGRAGDPEALRALGDRLGFSVTVAPPVLVDGEPVNSTRIRFLLSGGDVASAAALLGRPPVLIGSVAIGDRVGRSIGYPTANLTIDPHVLLPAHGVYAVHAFTGDPPESEPRPALLYVGTRPTLGPEVGALRCEVHLLTAPEADLYGERFEVHLLEHLREDRIFSTLEDLRRQIDRDADRAIEILARFRAPSAPIGG